MILLLLYVFYLFALAVMNMAAALEDTLPEDMRAIVEKEEEEDGGHVRPQAGLQSKIGNCIFYFFPSGTSQAFFPFPLSALSACLLQLPSWTKTKVERQKRERRKERKTCAKAHQ